MVPRETSSYDNFFQAPMLLFSTLSRETYYKIIKEQNATRSAALIVTFFPPFLFPTTHWFHITNIASRINAKGIISYSTILLSLFYTTHFFMYLSFIKLLLLQPQCVKCYILKMYSLFSSIEIQWHHLTLNYIWTKVTKL